MNSRLAKAWMALVYLFLYGPIIVLIGHSFNASRYGLRWEGFTLDWYRAIWEREELLEAALNSLGIALLSATGAAVLGSLGAIAVFRYRFRGREAVQGLLSVVMMSPDIVMAISLLVLFIVLHVTLGFWSLLLSHITFCLPFVAVTVSSRLSGFNPSIIEAARDLGAGEWTTVRTIILPLAMPAVIAGWLLAFTLSLDDVIVSFFVTGPSFEILPLRIYSMVRLGVKPEVNALAAVLFFVPLISVTAAHSLLFKEEKT